MFWLAGILSNGVLFLSLTIDSGEIVSLRDRITSSRHHFSLTEPTLLASELTDSPKTIQQITADSPQFNYSGRIDWQDTQVPAFSYPGTGVKFRFQGTSLKLELSEDNWNTGNYIDIYIDNNPVPKTIKLEPNRFGESTIIYDVAQGLEDTEHNVVLVKRNDYITGEFKFHSIIVDGKILAPEPDSQRLIEVYGDSISAGAVVESDRIGIHDPEDHNEALSNAYYSFASVLARDYDAELSLIAQSGASLIDGFGYWHRGTGMETFFDKVKPLRDAPTWNFTSQTPDLVIIALGQNDAATIKIGEDMAAVEWKQRYKQLIIKLRAKYPEAYFVGMFPNMYHDRQWDAYLSEAIAEYRQENNDLRVFSLIHQQVTPGHPRISEQEQMADTLKKFIDTKLVKNGFRWN